jgi:CRISPR-associated protein (Cas_Csd1)
MTRYPALARDDPAGLDVHGSGPVGSLVLRQVALSVVFGSAGQLVGVDDLTRGSGIKRAANRMLVPRLVEAPKTTFTNFLWDRSRRALGVRRTREPSGYCSWDHWALDDFRSFHRRILGDPSDLALQAFLKFVDRWSPAMTAIPAFADRLDPNVVFRFQYDDDFLHNRPAAREIWKPLDGGESVTALNTAGRHAQRRLPEPGRDSAKLHVVQPNGDASEMA